MEGVSQAFTEEREFTYPIPNPIPNLAPVRQSHNKITMRKTTVGPRATQNLMEHPPTIGMNPCIKKIILLLEVTIIDLDMGTIEDGEILLGLHPNPEGVPH